MNIGVVVVCYLSADVIIDCLQSLIDSHGTALRIVVVDNASPDDTVLRIREWAKSRALQLEEYAHKQSFNPQHKSSNHIAILRSELNLGFAGGVNLGLKALLLDRTIDLFWILNPDCIVTPDAARQYVAKAEEMGQFSLMGGRVIYNDAPNHIQSDGGRVNRWTGICQSINQGMAEEDALLPKIESIDFISGANVIASRIFLEQVGLMPEHYFLYYEEVDWARRRGGLPLIICPQAVVLHHGGTAIGSGVINRRSSGFSNYFNYRNRMWFMMRFEPLKLPIAFIYSLIKVMSLLRLRAWDEADGAFRGLVGLKPPKAVFNRLSPEAAKIAFNGKKRQVL